MWTRKAFLRGAVAAAGLVAMTATGALAAGAANPKLAIDVEGKANGRVVIELRPDLAPEHVKRITELAGEGAYDGVAFHRVIDGFMAQTGDVEFGKGDDLSRAGMGGSSKDDLKAEFTSAPFVRGTVGMARSSNPDSANSQFFIMFGSAPHLDGQYTVVGNVVEGMDVVDSIRRGSQSSNGAISGTPDRMKKVTVE